MSSTKKLAASIIIILLPGFVLSQSLSDSLDHKLESLWRRGKVVGFGVAVYSADSVFFMKGYGYADRETRRPYTPQTIQKIASVSKLVLGVALMKAQEMNLLSLNDDINKYLHFKLVNPWAIDSKITILHLATHTSGMKKSIFDYKALFFPHHLPVKVKIKFSMKKLVYQILAMVINHNKYMSMQDFLYKVYSPRGSWYFPFLNFVYTRPGQCWIYNNDDASFVGLAISKASGMPYSKFVHKHIFEPLGMTSTGFDFEMHSQPDSLRSSLYHFGVKIPNDYILILSPAGGIESSVADFTRFMQATIKGYNNGNKLLSKQSYNFMLKRHFKKILYQGIFWRIVYPQMAGHRGDIAGATTFAFFDKDRSIGYILFANSAGSRAIEQELKQITNILWQYSIKFYDKQYPENTLKKPIIAKSKSSKKIHRKRSQTCPQKKFSNIFIYLKYYILKIFRQRDKDNTPVS